MAHMHPPAHTPVHTMDNSILKLGGAPGVRVMWSPTHSTVAAHDHVFQEVVVVESGTCDHVTAAGRQTLRPGDIIVIRPHVWHAYENPRAMRIINCLFDNSLIRRFGGLLSGVDGAFVTAARILTIQGEGRVGRARVRIRTVANFHDRWTPPPPNSGSMPALGIFHYYRID